MKLSKEFLDKIINVTSNAAIACYPYLGKKDKILADKAATDEMRKNLNNLDIDGKVVIGEGELDEAPMLYIGEKLGTGKGPSIDIAVDPLEGTNFAAKNLPGALSVIAITLKGNLFNAPETYMDKLAVGKDVPKDATDLDFSIEKNIKNIAESKNKDLSKITACILDRPRHKNIIDKLKNLKVNLKLLSDGDISGALLVTDKKYKIDIFLGIGGGPEGVLAASALDAFDCKFQGRFLFKKDEDIFRAKKMGIGSAHKAGLRWCYKKRYHIVVTIDVDGTHDPKYIKLLIHNLKNNDIVITNRFTKKGSLRGWPINRIFLTYFRYLLVKSFLFIPYDSSGAFRCINCKKIPLSDLILAKDDGYSFFWESVFLLQRKKYKIFEVGIPMPYRQVGSSHMKLKDIYYAFFYLLFVFIKKIFGKYNY